MVTLRRSQPENDRLIYDNTTITNEQKVLAVTYFLSDKTSEALKVLERHSMPTVALYDWVYKCSMTLHAYLGDPANRDINKPKSLWDIIAVIPARGGSKGVPGKALREVGGRTLIARAVETCRAIRHVKTVFVNTDSAEIAEAARQAGAEVPFLRPLELATERASLKHAWLFARYWFQLVAGRCGDFWITVSATHPFLDVEEINIAVDRLTAANRPALQTVGQISSCNLDYCRLDPDGHLSEISNVHIKSDRSYFTQCGAFSINCYRPFYHLHPSFRPYVHEIPMVPEEPFAYVLDRYQAHDIDEEGDMRACHFFDSHPKAVRSCIPQDVVRHPVRKDRVTQTIDPDDLDFVGCVLLLPPDESCMVFEGRVLPCGILDQVLTGFDGPVCLSGSGQIAPLIAYRYGLQIIDLAHQNNMEAMDGCRPHMATQLHYPEMYINRINALDALGLKQSLRGLLIVDGAAAMLNAQTIREFMTHGLANDIPALNSVSNATVHPRHLKWLDSENSLQIVSTPPPDRRQDLDRVQLRDGVLAYWRAGHTGACQHGFSIPDAEAMLIRHSHDLLGCFHHSNVPFGNADQKLTS